MSSGKVVLINPNRMRPVIAPIGLDYIAAALRQKGYEVDILDLAFTRGVKNVMEQYFRSHKVDAVGITIRNTDDACYATQAFFIPEIKRIIGYVKANTDAPIIIGGCGFSVMPEPIMEYCDVDLGIRGEGEKSLPALLAAIKNDGDYSDIPGLIYRTDCGFKINPVQFLDLNQLSLSWRLAVDNSRYFKEGGQCGIETKRGCAKQCIYCADPVSKGTKYRLRAPESVADEFEVLLAQGITHFHLCDSEFNLPLAHAYAVCQELIKRNLGDRIKWYGYLSPEPFPEELAELMKYAGCVGINFGVDSGDAEMLDRLGRDFTPDDLCKTATICHKHQIVFMYDLLLGGPGETKQSIKETIELMRKIKPQRVGLGTGVRIYPGTRIAQEVGAQGRLTENPNLYGNLENNEHFFAPIYYISCEVGLEINSWIAQLVEDDPRFFFSNPEARSQNYNYNQNLVLVRAIKRGGYRGAYWDILRKLAEEKARSGTAGSANKSSELPKRCAKVKTMTTETAELTIYADYGERAAGILEMLESKGVKVVVKKLAVADYVLSQRVAVERKTAPDFLQSIKGKRLFRQILELKENFERPLFIIEGGHQLYEIQGVHPAGIRGAISFIVFTHGIPVIFSRDTIDTAEFLYIIAKQEQIGVPEVSLHAKKRAHSLAEQQRYLIECLPHIGLKLADALLRHFGNIQNIALATQEQLMQVPLIGEKKAKKIKELLTTMYRPEERKG